MTAATVRIRGSFRRATRLRSVAVSSAAPAVIVHAASGTPIVGRIATMRNLSLSHSPVAILARSLSLPAAKP